MTHETETSTRREFMANVGGIASAAAFTACLTPRSAEALGRIGTRSTAAPADWDLSWLDQLATGTDRAVFDWPSPGDPADLIVLDIAARYLDNCDAAYGPNKHEVRVVLNIRSAAVPVALNDAAWERYALGSEITAHDPTTNEPAAQNPFLHRAPDPAPGVTSPSLAGLVQRGAIVLVCDFALGHLAKRLAAKTSGNADDVHRELRGSFVPGSFAVPSGIFGLARAQNAGCAFVRM